MLIDFAFTIAMILAIFKGYQKGFIIAVFSIVAFALGLTAALKLSAVVASHLKGSINISDKWLPFIAFALVFFAVVLLVKFCARLVEGVVEAMLMGWVNRVAGMFIYAILYIVILSIFIFFTEKMQLLQPSTIKSSVTYPYIHYWGPNSMDYLGKVLPWVKDAFLQLGVFFDNLTNKIQH